MIANSVAVIIESSVMPITTSIRVKARRVEREEKSGEPV
jgi:hypothetical protein